MSDQPRPTLGARINRWTLGASKHWLRWFCLVVGLYVAGPFLAPTLMHLGLTGPANLLYTAYSPMCHQFAFRSWFLYGEQPAYPRALAHTPGLQPYENFAADINSGYPQPIDPRNFSFEMEIQSRQFIGNDRMGYKVAICERDIAIYGTLFLASLIYAIPIVRRHVRPVPIWLYLLLGVIPIGIDGFSQLLSYPPFNFWPPRESTPIFRTVTGACFGLMNAWLALPYLEASARDMVHQIQSKFDRRDRINAEAEAIVKGNVKS
jgi:uncharacterized membrane protein